MSSTRKIFYSSVLTLLSIIIIYFLLEIFLYFTSYPNQTALIYPRTDFIEEIGVIPKKNQNIYHSARGFPTKVYTVNADRYRGDLIPYNDNQKKIIVLGDSHSFGIGINDFETYPYKLDKLLNDYRVVNLSSPGWGLTHQINRYLTIGEMYNPDVIIIQFCSNDPTDNIREKSIEWNEKNQSLEKIKIQKNEYNNLRLFVKKFSYIFDFLSGYSLTFNRLKQIYAHHLINKGVEIAADTDNKTIKSIESQKQYIFLLNKFIEKLNSESKYVIMIDPVSQLRKQNPYIYKNVMKLDKQNKISYFNTEEWVPDKLHKKYNLGPIFTHYWGNYSNKWISINLAQIISENYLNEEFNWFKNIRTLDLIDKCSKTDCLDKI